MSRAAVATPKTLRTDFAKLIRENAYGRNEREAFEAFVKLAACAVAAGTREEDYLAEAKRWDDKQLQRFSEALFVLVDVMERDPFMDALGPLWMEIQSGSSQKWNGEFYTPPALCRMMAEMTMHAVEIPSDRPITIMEPACGSGAMILAAAEKLVNSGFSPLNMQATCVDVSRTACDMAYLQLTLSSIPSTIVHGNSISLETWGGWRNIWWSQARGRLSPLEAALLKLIHSEPITPAESAPPVVAEVEQVEILRAVQTQTGQFAWDFSEAVA